MRFLGVFLGIAALCGLARGAASQLMMQIEPRTQECFEFFPNKNDNYLIRVHVIRGGLLDIKVRV